MVIITCSELYTFTVFALKTHKQISEPEPSFTLSRRVLNSQKSLKIKKTEYDIYELCK